MSDGYADRTLPNPEYGVIRENTDAMAMICNDRDHSESGSAAQRKRIAVACGRCRKRKIRCSGDSGLGEPCTNCRNANYEPCQFLRVASTEAPLRAENGGFDICQQLSSRSNGSLGSPYADSGPNSHHGSDLLQLRGPALYGYPGRSPYYAISEYSEEPGVDYPVCPPEYHQVQDHTYMAGYRALPPAPYTRPNNAIYMDSTGPSSYEYTDGTVPQAHQFSQSGSGSPPYPQPVLSTGLTPSLALSSRSLPDPTRRAFPYAGAPQTYRDSFASQGYSRESPENGASPSDSLVDGPNYDTPSPSSYSATSVSLARPPSMYNMSSDTGAGLNRNVTDMTYRYHDTTRLPTQLGDLGAVPMANGQSYLTNTSPPTSYSTRINNPGTSEDASLKMD